MRLLTAALAAVLLGAAVAPAAEAPTGWGGENPFNCVLQQAGFEATGPDPGADPYCVEFDKTRQNVTQGGVVEFLSKEPERVAAASDKCFYFQSDHWRGSVVQEDGSTKTYEWDGHYYFDKATGDGGVWVTNFNLNGQTQDPSAIPGLPPEYAQHFGPGTGGVRSRNQVESDPRCAERAQREPEKIYATQPSAAGPNGGARGCIGAAGRVTRRRVGPVRLGEKDAAVRARLGDPATVRRGFLRYCVTGGGRYLVGQPGDRSGELGSDPGAPSVLLWSNHRGLLPKGRVRGRRLARLGRTRVVARRGVLYGVRAQRARWVAVADRGRLKSRARVRGALRRALLR